MNKDIFKPSKRKVIITHCSSCEHPTCFEAGVRGATKYGLCLRKVKHLTGKLT